MKLTKEILTEMIKEVIKEQTKPGSFHPSFSKDLAMVFKLILNSNVSEKAIVKAFSNLNEKELATMGKLEEKLDTVLSSMFELLLAAQERKDWIR